MIDQHAVVRMSLDLSLGCRTRMQITEDYSRWADVINLDVA